MGNYNIQRLKAKLGLSKDDEDVNIYLELIDRIYYEDQNYFEEFDENIDSSNWVFDDGTLISMDSEQVINLALFLMKLYNDADEQAMSVESLNNCYFLKENCHKNQK